VLSSDDLKARVRSMVEMHPDRAQVSTWRIVSQGTVDALNASMRGRLPDSVRESYDSVRRRIES
jgi:hypothetical protein